ncbi:MAG: NADH-quinone oxidoreductase subunit C [Bacteroidales bacterium]|nr:NADH-quinone oxidoreductase subunit C [Bacteroidales bacterium]
MEKDFQIDELKKHFKDKVILIEKKNNRRIFVHISPDAVVKISDFLFSNLHYRFIIASALQSNLGFEIYYHFSNDKNGEIVNLHVILPAKKTAIESLTGLFEAANWIEREMHEILGIDFLNHPNLEKLISEGNWAEGVYPYRIEK